MITDGTGGVARCLRVIVASTSPPVSTNRFATERTVVSVTPTRRATNTRSATGPTFSSNANNTRARMIIRAGWAPTDTTLVNRSRSPADRPTGNTFGRGITPVLSSRGKTAQNTTTPDNTTLSGDTLLALASGQLVIVRTRFPRLG